MPAGRSASESDNASVRRSGDACVQQAVYLQPREKKAAAAPTGNAAAPKTVSQSATQAKATPPSKDGISTPQTADARPEDKAASPAPDDTAGRTPGRPEKNGASPRDDSLAWQTPRHPGNGSANLFQDEASAPQIADPLEKWNRFWFRVNDGIYLKVARPISRVYSAVVPRYLRDRINNVYQNALFPARFVNALLQLRLDKAARELGRFFINSTFGLGGMYDLAAGKPGMGPQDIDFGQTLGVWGMGHGFYLVLPFLGPSSFRDGIGLLADSSMLPTSYLGRTPYLITLGGRTAGAVNSLPETLKDYLELQRIAIEPYTALRDAYAQSRAKLVEDARQPMQLPARNAGREAPAQSP